MNIRFRRAHNVGVVTGSLDSYLIVFNNVCQS